MKIHADDLPDTVGDDLGIAAVEVDAADLGISRRRHADIARRADVKIEPIVGPDDQELPAVRLVVWQIAVYNGRFSVAKMAFDVVNLGNLVLLATA